MGVVVAVAVDVDVNVAEGIWVFVASMARFSDCTRYQASEITSMAGNMAASNRYNVMLILLDGRSSSDSVMGSLWIMRNDEGRGFLGSRVDPLQQHIVRNILDLIDQHHILRVVHDQQLG